MDGLSNPGCEPWRTSHAAVSPVSVPGPDGRTAVYVSWRGIAPPERVWAISIARLSASPRLHLRPIDVIVSDGPCVEILS